MRRSHFFLSILIIASLLTGCTPDVTAQADQVKALKNPTPTTIPGITTKVPTAALEIVPHDPPPNCPITVPQNPLFVPPSPYSPDAPWENYFWFGSASLWTLLPSDGSWEGFSSNPEAYGEKVFWWREGYVGSEEPEPEITVTAERLDAPAPAFTQSGGTNAYADDIGSAMLTGVTFSTPGCWKVTGTYKDAELSFVVWITTSEVVPHDPPASCPITVPQEPPFVPPAPYDSMGFEGEFWYGSSSLWTAVRENGTWEALPHNPEGYTQKVFWWRDGYVWNQEPQPALTVTGERLDAPAPPLHVSDATNASASDIGSAMLVGVDMPTLGCWRITGKYGGTELSFVVWVAP